MSTYPKNLADFFDNGRDQFPEGHEYRTKAPETVKLPATMTDQQKTAVEQLKNAANPYGDYDTNRDVFDDGWEECEKAVITNPSDFGLVSKEEMFEFLKWMFSDSTYIPARSYTDGSLAWLEPNKDEMITDAHLYEIFKNKP